ncbi:hypothetical protein DET48_1071 [Vibrio diazotrophicus]|uniref:Uncharacterized protein n=1 Tax=Vibrio diazotrophicus TaxID=685 RepID=A0A329EHV0_VIBDI|nr:hypothetical protein [Vibrio diazotrophicus]RAS65289.1 hypothetical protein DET48_1071 [Vibrio diazotrophicus]
MNSEQLSAQIFDVNKYSHINYLHPNRMEWEKARSDKELDFLSKSLVGQDGQQDKAVAYLHPNSTAKCDTRQYQAANAISLNTIAGCLKPKHFLGR